MDGGSVWGGVVDRSGASYDFAFLIDNLTNEYPTEVALDYLSGQAHSVVRGLQQNGIRGALYNLLH